MQIHFQADVIVSTTFVAARATHGEPEENYLAEEGPDVDSCLVQLAVTTLRLGGQSLAPIVGHRSCDRILCARQVVVGCMRQQLMRTTLGPTAHRRCHPTW